MASSPSASCQSESYKYIFCLTTGLVFRILAVGEGVAPPGMLMPLLDLLVFS